MSVAAFLTELRRQDIQVWPEGDQLRCSAPAGALTPALRDQLRQQKTDIVQFLRSAEALARQQRAIVPLQPRGNRNPVFAIGGHNGDVFCFRALSQHLGDDQPFFGLEPPGLDGQSKPLDSVEKLAAYFADQIRAFQPDGPYVIAGYCAGGTIAVELARQLQQEGATIECVTLLAGPYPSWYRFLPQLRHRLITQIKRVRTHIHAMRVHPDGARGYLADKLRERAAQRATVEGTDPVLQRRAALEKITLEAVRRHTPQYFDGRLVLILPSDEWMRSRDPLLAKRWRSRASQVHELCGSDGYRGDRILLEPYVEEAAELFRLAR